MNIDHITLSHIKVMNKTLYYIGQNVDNATEVLILLFGVQKVWKDLNSH